MKNQFVLPYAEIDGNVVLDLDRKCRAAPGDMNIAWADGNIGVPGLPHNFRANLFGGFLFLYCKFHFAVNEIRKLECVVVNRDEVDRSEDGDRQDKKEKELAGIEAKHRARL